MFFRRSLAGWVAVAWVGAAVGAQASACGAVRMGVLGLAGGLIALCGASLTRQRAVWLAAGLGLAFAGLGALTTEAVPADEAPADGTSVRGRVVGVQPMPAGRRVTLRSPDDGSAVDVLVRRTGEAWLDDGPRLRPGERARILIRPNRSRPEAATALCAASVRRVAPASLLDRLLAFPARARQLFQERAAARLVSRDRDRAGGLLMALVTGRRDWLAAGDRRALRWSGLAHLAVVSGLHVGLVVLGVSAVCRLWLGRAHRAGQLVSLLASLGALVLLPSTPPVRRAAFALLFARAGGLSGRGGAPGHALAVAAILLLALWPSLATSWSFALTVSATAAILLALRWRGAWAVPVTALAPFLATWPLLVWMTGRLSPWGPIANALAAPVVPLALAGGWFQVLSPAPVEWLAEAARLPARWVLAVGAETSRWAGSGAYSGPVGAVWVGLTLAALACALSRRGGSRARWATWLALAGLWAWPIVTACATPPARLPSLCMLDVGQGQSLLLRDRDAAWLVDTGSGWADRAVRAGLARRGARRLNGVVLTHLDEDHAGGLAGVLAGTRPRWVAAPSSIRDDPAARRLAAAAARRGIAWHWLSGGDYLRQGRLALRVLWPDPGLLLDGNPGGLVLRVRAGRLRGLILGDAPLPVERRLRARGHVTRCPVLIASHHGAREGTSTAVLRAARPRWVGISCGPRNRFGHPHPNVLTRIANEGAATWRTDLAGGVCWTRTGAGADRRLRVSLLELRSRPRWGVGGIRPPGSPPRPPAAPSGAGRAGSRRREPAGADGRTR